MERPPNLHKGTVGRIPNLHRGTIGRTPNLHRRIVERTSNLHRGTVGRIPSLHRRAVQVPSGQRTVWCPPLSPNGAQGPRRTCLSLCFGLGMGSICSYTGVGGCWAGPSSPGLRRTNTCLPAPPGALALECYSCVQKADNGCAPHKMKTVKCAEGVEVCTEAVGAVETSKWGFSVNEPFQLLQPGPVSCSPSIWGTFLPPALEALLWA